MRNSVIQIHRLEYITDTHTIVLNRSRMLHMHRSENLSTLGGENYVRD